MITYIVCSIVTTNIILNYCNIILDMIICGSISIYYFVPFVPYTISHHNKSLVKFPSINIILYYIYLNVTVFNQIRIVDMSCHI